MLHILTLCYTSVLERTKPIMRFVAFFNLLFPLRFYLLLLLSSSTFGLESNIHFTALPALGMIYDINERTYL